MANLLTAIQAINGPPNYTNTVTADKVISREPLSLVELSHAHQMPAALLEEQQQTINPHFAENSAFVPSALSLSTFEITILALLVKRGGVNTELNAWMADILKAVTVDSTRGGAAIDTFLLSIGPPKEDTAVPDDLAAAEMRFIVKYIHSANQL